MVCCGLGRDESVGSAPWRVYVLCLTLASGLAGALALMAVSALSGVSTHCQSWRSSVRAFLVGTIGPRLSRFADQELFVGLARWRCRLSGSLVGRSPRLGGVVYRYFNVAVLFGMLTATGALVALSIALV